MGYSIGVHARSKALQKKMLDFMSKEYRPHWKIRTGLPKGYRDCYSSEPLDNPSYLRGKTVVGIDYNASGWERGYAFTLVRWMALKVSQHRRVFKEPKITFRERVPSMSYDGCRVWPVLLQPLSAVPKHVRGCCVDRFGMKLDVTQAEDYAFEIDAGEGKEFNVAHAEACRKHGIDPNNWPKPENEPAGVRRKIHDTTMRILWPEVKKVLVPMRAEMKRLDQAWSKL